MKNGKKLMTYEETISFLFNKLPSFQRIGKAAYKANLDNTLALDMHFGFPHKAFRSIHVAGTNGKGSVSHMLAAVLQEAGLKVGLYTSPHLKDFRERIRINGQLVEETRVIDFVNRNLEVIETLKPSFFELTVAMAFEFFKESKVDIAVIEVGMGGRLDSTNIITPELSIITNISYDHTEFLGKTLSKIAGEKAGIIKPNIPVVIGESNSETNSVFISKAKEVHSPIIFADQIYQCDYSTSTAKGTQLFSVFHDDKLVYKNLEIDLMGLYQRKNILSVVAAIDILKNKEIRISENQIRSGLRHVSKSTGLRGRWEILSFNPLIICDTGHNEGGLTWTMEQLSTMPFKKLHMVVGMVADKDIVKMLALLPPTATYYFTKANIPRALDPLELKNKAATFKLEGNIYTTISEALAAAKSNAGVKDIIFVGGSTFVVAEVV